MFFGDLVITLLLRSGEFAGEEVRVVSWILRGYAVGLIAASTVRLLTAGFYAVGDYRTPLRASVAAIVTSAALAITLAWLWRESVLGAAGIALGSALGC
jgi:putative peptidoglycan lipid II flippase